MNLWLWLTVILAGAAGQFLDSLAGMGFGALSSTVMLASGITPAIVVGTVNISKIGSGLVSGLSHLRMGNVKLSWSYAMLPPALLGGVAAALVVTRASQEAVRLFVPIVLLLMGLLILRRFLLPSSIFPRVGGGSQDATAMAQPRKALSLPRIPSAVWLGLIGLVGGALNGLSGAFGPFATSAVVLKQGGHPRFAVGTVNFVEFFVAVAVSVTIISQVSWSEFQWGLPLALLAGSLVTAPIGAYLCRRINARAMGALVGLALVALNVWSIYKVIAS